MTTTYDYSDTTPMLMSQVDAEAGFAGPPAAGFAGPPAAGFAGPPSAGFAGGSAWTQEPTANGDFTGADLRIMHSKGDKTLILSIVTFICCFFCTSASMICTIPAMLFAAKSRVSAEKKDYYESKLMLHWSYICTFAGCFIGWVLLAAIIVMIIAGAITASANSRHTASY